MSGETSIEWATHVWNPTKGCDRVSPGCDHCYALTMAKRLKGMGSPGYQQDGDPRTSGPGFLAHESPRDLDWPLRKTKPMRVFVNSMSDLFHDNISDDFIACVFAVMAVAEQHTFQVLTKRHARMRSLLNSADFRHDVALSIVDLRLAGRGPEEFADPFADWWPLPNVLVGVSVENQQWADIRIPALLDTPAAVRFLSCEPLLGLVDVSDYFRYSEWRHIAVDWVIAGGESGPGARPMQIEWARSLRDQCRAAGVAFHFKQFGEYAPRCRLALSDGHESVRCSCNGTNPSHPISMQRVGKKAAGRVLDGRTWDEYPERAA